MGLLEHVEGNLVSRRLVPDGRTIVAAVSGGLDSMVLLELLHRLAPMHRWCLVVAHFNHRLRGMASRRDMLFVKAAAKKLGLPFQSGSADVRRTAKREGISVEMAARHCRHQFLAAVARKHHARHVVLGHHADDQVELFLLRWLRGTGGEGLRGMLWRNPSPADSAVWLVRPLLDVTRKELETYARQAGLTWREDASNDSLDILRNRLRHRVLPVLRQCQPALARATIRLLDIVAAEANLASQMARQWLRARHKTAFEELPVAVQRCCLRDSLLRRGIQPDFETIEHFRLHPDCPLTVRGGQTLVRVKSAGLKRWRPAPLAFLEHHLLVPLAGSHGCVQLERRQVRWRVFPRQGQRWPAFRKGREYFDADKVGSPIIFRHWKPGDRYTPCGARHSVKLQDAFVNEKVPLPRRRRLLLATDARGQIFWVEGLRIGDPFKLTRDTRNILEISWL